VFGPEEMIKRLKPILGAQADALWRAYLVADPGERRILTQVLENLHAQWVDDYCGEKIILPPPSLLEQLLGEYSAGVAWYGDRPFHPFAFLEKELGQHIGVFGRTGVGKSFFVKGLLRQILARRPVLVFDWKGTYVDLCNRDVLFFVPGSSTFPFYFNPLDLDGIDEDYRKTYLRQVIELFLAASCRTAPGSRSDNKSSFSWTATWRT